MYSNRTRLVGLSGIDTDTLVKQLMQAESVKYNNLKKQNTILKWQQEKYRDVASMMKTFQTSFLDALSPTSMRMSGTFGGYTATVKTVGGSDSSKVTVKTTGNSKEGSYSLQVKQLASKSTVSSTSEMTYGGKLISEASFSVDDLKVGDTLKFTLDGVSKTIEITSDFLTAVPGDLTATPSVSALSKKEAFAKELGKALDNAYGKTSGFFDVKLSGSKLEIKMTEGGHDLKIYDGTRKNLNYAQGDVFVNDFKIPIGGGGTYDFKINGNTVNVNLNDGDNLTQIVKKINEAIKDEPSVKDLKISASISKDNRIVFTSNNESEDIKISAGSTKDLLENIVKFDPIDFGGSINIELENTSICSDLGFKSGTSTLDTVKMKVVDLFNLSTDPTDSTYLFNSDGIYELKIVNGVKIELKKDDTLESLINKINNSDAGVNLKYDSITKIFTMEAKNEGKLDGFKNGEIGSVLAGWLKFDNTKVTEGKDAEFTLNGVATTRNSNTFDIDGLKITLNEATGTEEININIKKDPTKAMDAIKGFVNAYNELIAKINGEVDAKRAKNGKYSYYEPLTDEEKKAMSESEIKLWEDKAKEGILGRDTILSGITRDMRNAMYLKVEIAPGKSLSLHEIGITTSSNYWEGGKLVIDEEKLSKALEEHGDDVAKLFTTSTDDKKGFTGTNQGLGQRINNIVNAAVGLSGTITEKAGVKEHPSSLTTSKLYDQIRKQEQKISDMLDRLIEKEDYYYSMFSKMEAAVMKANSQAEYLAAQLG